jgi:hypothetical protein
LTKMEHPLFFGDTKFEAGHPLKGLSPIKGVVKRKNTSPSGTDPQNPVATRH